MEQKGEQPPGTACERGGGPKQVEGSGFWCSRVEGF